MSDFIGIDITGDKAIAAALERVPFEVGDAIVDDVSDYIIKVYKHYPPKKSISRAEAFPHLKARTPTGKMIVGYASWKQFKKVMALRNEGKIPYKRTQTLRNNWKQYGSGMKSIIANETSYAGYVMGENDNQSNMHRMIGWMNFDKIFIDRRERINQIIDGAIKKGLRKLGFS